MLIGIGLLLVLVGVLVWSGAFAWFGKLPGDFRYESGSTRIYVPLASMLVVSLVLSLIGFLARRFF